MRGHHAPPRPRCTLARSAVAHSATIVVTCIYTSEINGEHCWLSNSLSTLISAGRGKLLHALDSFEAEVVACLQGLQAGIDLGVTRVHMETDAIQVQQAIQSKSWELTAVGGLI